MQTESMDLSLYKKPTVWRREGESFTPQQLDERIKNYMRTYKVDYRTAFVEIISGE